MNNLIEIRWHGRGGQGAKNNKYCHPNPESMAIYCHLNPEPVAIFCYFLAFNKL